MSAEAIQRAKVENALMGAFAAGLAGARFSGPVGFWVGLIVGGLVGYGADPEAS